jgi:hypothetical protein
MQASSSRSSCKSFSCVASNASCAQRFELMVDIPAGPSRTLSASWSESSFSRRRKSSRSSLSRALADGVCGRLSSSSRMLSSAGFAEGVNGRLARPGLVTRWLGVATSSAGWAAARSEVAQLPWSTLPPVRQVPSSASRRAM